MKVDVIIPTNRPAAGLISVLESFKKQSYQDFTILLITEGEQQALQEICNQIRIPKVAIFSIPSGTSNAAFARNTGLRHATGEIIVFSDDDMVVSADFIMAHVNSHKIHNNAIVRGLRYQKRADGSFYLPRWEQNAIKHWKMMSQESSWAYFVTSNASVSMSMLKQIDGFDMNFTWSGCEDTDLAYRLLQEGAQPVTNENAVNYHLGIDDMQIKFEKRIGNFKYLREKYPHDSMIQWFVRLTLRTIQEGQVEQLFLGE
ncbi:glycosyltransferase family 2 protein [Lacrimispora brassicae]